LASALPTKISLGWKYVPGANTLVNYGHKTLHNIWPRRQKILVSVATVNKLQLVVKTKKFSCHLLFNFKDYLWPKQESLQFSKNRQLVPNLAWLMCKVLQCLIGEKSQWNSTLWQALLRAPTEGSSEKVNKIYFKEKK
jgi:hypothetical protein